MKDVGVGLGLGLPYILSYIVFLAYGKTGNVNVLVLVLLLCYFSSLSEKKR